MSATSNFIQAKCYHHANRAAVDLIIIHTMELPCQPGIARRLGERFRDLDLSKSKPKSAHFGVDPAEVWQYVHEADVAWHCPKANRRGIGVEHAGRALPAYDAGGRRLADPTDWASLEGQAVLRLSAGLVARLCRAWGVPIERPPVAALPHGARGIVGHWDVTRAFPGSGTHVDPGPAWPWDAYLEAVRTASAGL